METFSVRLNCIDYYQSAPSEFDPPVPHGFANSNLRDRPLVSVIRVFGATETGQKVLMHIHGAFQYLYIEYTGSLVREDVDTAIHLLELAINRALAVSYRKNPDEREYTYIAHISLVKGIPFYGFHVGYKFYLKIYLLNPLHSTKLADLLREGGIMGRILQPYESHMQYLAQWMCDYNLYGCAYINCREARFRKPVPAYLELGNLSHRWHDQSIPPEYLSNEEVLPKESHCALEVDVCVQDILNREDIHARSLHQDFIEKTWPSPLDLKFVQSMAGLWKDETKRRKARLGLTDSNSSPFPPEVLMTMSADPRNSQAGGWIHEEEYRQKIGQIARAELEQGDGENVDFDTFVKREPLEVNVKTALESVQDLFPKNLALAELRLLDRPPEDADIIYKQDKIVDEDRIAQLRDDAFSDTESHTLITSDRLPPGAKSNPSSRSSNDPVHDPGTDVALPISSSEYENLGVRRAGDLSHVHEDEFEIPNEYIAAKSRIGEHKRSALVGAASEPRTKRRKILIDEKDLLPDLDSSISSAQAYLPDFAKAIQCGLSEPGERSGQLVTSRHSQNTAAKTPSQLNGIQGDLKASFPIVKDPVDSNKVNRFSQQSNPSVKLSQKSPRKPQGSASISQGSAPELSASSSQRMPISARPSDVLPVCTAVPSGIAMLGSDQTALVFSRISPSFAEVQATMGEHGLPDVIYQNAFYSNEDDVPDRQREYAGRDFRLQSDTVPYLPPFDPTGLTSANYGLTNPVLLDREAEEKADRKRRRLCKISEWSIERQPPTKAEVVAWLQQGPQLRTAPALSDQAIKTDSKLLSQIDAPTQKNRHGYKYSQKHESSSVHCETQYMSIMSLEVHVNTRGNLAPNPEEDEIACVFWSVQSDDDNGADDDELEISGSDRHTRTGILINDGVRRIANILPRILAVEVEAEPTELGLLTRVTDIVRQYDPDILTGYEVHNSSWGFLIERARFKYELNLCDELSRMKVHSRGRFGRENDKWGFNQTSTIGVTGRHTINIWRAMRGELNLLQYTMENVVFHLLHRRIPHYKFADLTGWYGSRIPRDLCKLIDYFVTRVQLDLEILEANELVPRTSEQARLLGVDWFSVISRGSQFKVESLMFRIAKPENFILVSPSRRQVGGQNALECLPLVMEPQSDFYTSPLLVLDFQSLYPSVMIAYNYCYSTFLGRVVNWRGTNKMGFTNYRREKRLIELLKDDINIAPNGIMYARTHIRKSLLAKMLGEILETRVMVKSGMKADKEDKTLQRLLNNRQLALKLIANVTYGYTSASFSGRMPCSEIADSIVQTGRETLEKAIALIHSVERWGAEVVYGDTDSLFIYLKGRTRDQAFDIGEDIAKAVTDVNPRPVKLKFEKVYHPCVLLAKKRYVGFKYEHRDQKVPEFDAKGIETVRRDGTPAEQKIEEKALKILFKTADLSRVKRFFQSQCAKIMKGRVSVQDFCFAREVKLGTYSDKGPPPPGALISARRMIEDPRLEPQYGERVPYVVITGGPGARLIDRCVAPEALLHDAQSDLDSEYYISKNLIPPLERIFNLVGANVRQWYDEMPKFQRIRRIEGATTANGRDSMARKTLESYMKSSICIVCRESLDGDSPICNSCFDQSGHTMLLLRGRMAKAEKTALQVKEVCRSCSGLGWTEEVKCDSKDCPVFYSRTRHMADMNHTKAQLGPVLRALEDRGERGLDW